MDSATRACLRDLTLKARRLLTEEVRGTLEGVYGLAPEGSFEPAERLPAVQELDEVRTTRRILEAFLADETEAGLSGKEAVDKLVGEIAFTHLNRLVAFKMLESRTLIRGTLDKHHESNAFKRYVVEDTEDYERYIAGDLPQDRLGEGPRDVAYRHFLLAQCARMAGEIKVLFDPNDLASRLFPRPRALRDLIEMLNAPEVAEAWSPGSDETLGWVYQYFNEREKAEVFEKLNKKKQKIRARDVPAATQLFTPRWIVRQLVHNTLGRLWVEMHPDSWLRDSLDYLVPLAGEAPPPPLKLARKISVLDPACGTMHFGLVAFDLLAEMYREELENAGASGWPEEPSVADEAEIPAAIVRCNLFGMDIDLRAVQLSALTLYLKAKSLNPDVAITGSNLACADVRLLNGERLDALVREAGFDRPIYERLVRAAWKRLGNISIAGSLVRVEEEIRDLIRRERERYNREGHQPDLLDEGAVFEEEAAGEQFWTLIESRILNAFDAFARHQAEAGNDESYFVGEATKGLRVLDVMLRRYDVVAANPPYMAKSNANKALADFLDSAYPTSKGDLYAAFIERCAELLNENGRIGMIAQQSFMFISSYEKMRTALLEEHSIEIVCHVGPHTFAEAKGEKVNTVMFVLRREGENRQGDKGFGTYFRLVREPDAKAKRLGFERSLVQLRSGEYDPAVFRYRQGDLRAIPKTPWVYWIAPGLRRLFETLPKLTDVADSLAGMHGGDRVRFARFWWEVGVGNVGRNCPNRAAAFASGKRWFPYMKGGASLRWYGNQEWVVAFDQAHYEILSKAGNRLPSRQYYFRPGVTYSSVASGRFSARLSPGGFIFADAGSSIFTNDILLILALLNSSFARYALELMNPTVNLQSGDLARLPIPKESSDALQHLVDEAIELAKADSVDDEMTYDFVAPPDWETGPDDVRYRKERLAEIEAEIDEEVYRLYGISGEDRTAIESELAEPVVAEDEEGAPGREEAVEDTGIVERGELALRWISYAVGVVLGRFSPGEEGALGRGRFSAEVAVALGELVDPDGVATLQADHPDDLAMKVEKALELMVGEDKTPRLLEAAGIVPGTSGLRLYLEKDFFKWHVKLYRKRPVYWLLQSPRKSYGLYLFHERITPDTLFLLGGNRYLGGGISRSRDEISDLSARASTAPQGGEKKSLAKELEAAEELLLDLETFARNLSGVTSQTNSRGEAVGWRPELDDGVILNLAPLHTLMPSWSAEPKKAWVALEAGSYDWSRTAIRYWPDRVLEECRKKKSYAIAHGRVDAYVGGK